MKSLLLALPLLAAACVGPDAKGSFHIAEGFTEAERQAIELAAEDVNAFTGHPMAIEVAPDGVYPIAPQELGGAKGGEAHLKIDSQYGEYGTDIAIDVSAIKGKYGDGYLPVFRVVVAHEMLHHLGMKHHPGKGIMATVYGDALDFSEDDRAQCFKDRVCTSR